MEAYLMALGFEVLQSVMDAYEFPKSPQRGQDKKMACEDNETTRNFILCSLSNYRFVKIMHYMTVNEVWVKLHNTYEGELARSSKKIFKYTNINLRVYK